MKPIETYSRLRARLLKDWGHWKYHLHDDFESGNFFKALVSQNFNVVLVVVDEVDEEELELPEELN